MNYPDDIHMVSMEQLHLQLRQQNQALSIMFNTVADMMKMVEETRLMAEHTLDMVARWPYVKPVGGKK